MMLTFHIPNVIVTTITLPNRVLMLGRVRRYPTDCLHTNRQLEALNVLFARRRVRFWDEVLS